jgi:hypothetical protein
MWRQAALLRRDLVKRLLVYLCNFDATSAASEPKGVPPASPSATGTCVGPRVGDPAGAINE